MLPKPFIIRKAQLVAMAASLGQRVMASVVLRYALAPVFVLLAALVFHSPPGPTFSLAGLCVIAVLATAWLGGVGPGLLAAVLANFMIPQLIDVPYALLWGLVDVPRFVTFSIIGLAVGWRSSRLHRVLRDQERHALAMAASEDGFWDWLVAEDSVYVSPRWLEIYGLPPDTVFAGRKDLIERISFHPDDRARLTQGLSAHFAGKDGRYGTEARFIRKGETRWIQLAGLATRDASGTLVRWTGTARDITERKQSEEALRESEQRYELAMAASESGYWDWHVPSNTYFASPRAFELAGYPKGTTWANRDDYRANINMHPDDFVKWEAARLALFAGTGERLAMEVRYMAPGGVRWHKLQAICRRDEEGKVVRWTGSATDTTAQRQAEEELGTMERKLRQAQRLESMGTLSGGIAHDFNNILGAILGYGEMALRGATPGSRLARDLDSIMVAGERGRALVERLLAFSRSGVGERVPVHVEKVVREVLDLVSGNLPASVTVHARLHAGAAAVLGDATQVHQVVANLATNAVQAMQGGGTLRVELVTERVASPQAGTIGRREPGEYVVLTVADTGGGIAPEVMDRIFDPFFTTKDVGTGTGLGLSLVHGIVTELGGAIDVASTVGEGCTFVVHLPRAGDAVERGDERTATPPRGDGQRVLVVDDEQPLVQLATRTLQALGYQAVGFSSSTAALAEFRQDPQRFDALVTDERMPEMSGAALIREVRSMRSGMPIVLMSGFLGEGTLRPRTGGLVNGHGEQAGPALADEPDEVLQKPVSGRELADSLARVLRR
ncbi:ATP-binding protein [Variovorax sp. OV329]|uniref:ATP-binding protein n=1 Tax=Variovorax sp. OV329 TaxID=1882825 RepID=UPI0011136F35|nr:ATP-binding protein [Variovorax sp. OV329]